MFSFLNIGKKIYPFHKEQKTQSQKTNPPQPPPPIKHSISHFIGIRSHTEHKKDEKVQATSKGGVGDPKQKSIRNSQFVERKKLVQENSIYQHIIKSNRSSVHSNVDASDDNVTYMKCLFHDFRGPINNIILATNVLEEFIDVKHHDIIKNIQESCEFMTRSLNGFLNIKMPISNEHKKINILKNPFNIIGTIKKIQFLLLYSLQEKNINFSFHYDDALNEWVIGDEHNLQHAILNIVNNAIKFSKDDSNISVVVSCEKNATTQQLIIIRIIDENDPIPPQIKERLFEKYVTSNNNIGTGLGLYITKKIIQLHDGTIEHHYDDRGDVGVGNIFEIRLPLHICHQKFDQRKNSCDSNSNNSQIGISIEHVDSLDQIDRQDTLISDVSNNQKINMVVCDDSVISRKMMVKLIEASCNNMGLKHHIYQVGDGLDAVTTLHNKLNKISIIFIDNVMPHLAGPLTIKLLRALGYENLVIGITGNSVEDDIKEFYGCGANYVFIKPFHKSSLQMVLDLYGEQGAKQKERMVLKIVRKKLEWVEVEMCSDCQKFG